MFFWSDKIGHEVYIYCNGELIMKRWYDNNGKCLRTAVFNKGWLTEWISETNG